MIHVKSTKLSLGYKNKQQLAWQFLVRLNTYLPKTQQRDVGRFHDLRNYGSAMTLAEKAAASDARDNFQTVYSARDCLRIIACILL